MIIKTKSVEVILTSNEVGDLEQEFFTLMSNYKGKFGSEGITLFQNDFPLLYELYLLIKKKMN